MKLVSYSIIFSIVLAAALIYFNWFYNQQIDSFPSFQANDTSDNINPEYLNFIKLYDFAITYHGLSEDEGSSAYKILGCKANHDWEAVIVNYSGPFDSGERKVSVKKIPNASLIIDSLRGYGFFNLPQEEELVTECVKHVGERWRHIYHGHQIQFEIIQGSKVRKLSYTGINDRIKLCPQIKEWSGLIKIKRLIEKNVN